MPATRLPSALQSGRPEPFGSLVRDGGVNFAVFSDNAERIELCIYDASGSRELRRYEMHGPRDGVFHGFLPHVGEGLVYGLRAYGPYAPEQGHRFNPAKLLLDPYAREIVGAFAWRADHHGHELGHPGGNRFPDRRDNGTRALKARVAAAPAQAAATWNAPRHAPSDLVMYEVHVKSFSKRHPDVPPDMRGTYAGLAHPASIRHLKQLGVNALSLLPVQYHLDEAHLVEKGLVNHWGYNTLGFFCPEPRFSMHRDDPAAVTQEFRDMVSTMHAHGIEVLLDVVYNHSAEGDENGPTLSFRGLDNASWYRLDPEDRSHCENLTGCGNTLNVEHPRITQWVLDSLRYWVEEMGVDGFRFDLAPVLGRTRRGYNPNAAFFTALRQDPTLARVHLIAEPWDTGYDGYQLGRFPGRFLEWNDKFRDSVRRYWMHRGVGRGELARRFTASSDLFHHGHRRPSASVNFISAHDGFSLADMVSYSHKHNQANGEDNRDGRDGEPSTNCGVEGPTTDRAVLARRDRLRRAMFATTVLAQGTPMLRAGDEIGQTQGGNNNAYCQDNDTNWFDWARADSRFLDFASRVIALRREEPALRHDRWFLGSTGRNGDRGIVWFTPAGGEMHVHDWHDPGNHAFACRISVLADGSPEAAPHHVDSDPVMVVFNAESQPVSFALPDGPWVLRLDSSDELSVGSVLRPGVPLRAPPSSLLVLRHASAQPGM